MLGIAKIADLGLIAAASITAVIALLGIMALDVSAVFGLLVSPIALMFSAAVLAYVGLRHNYRSATNAGLIALVAIVVIAAVLVSDAKLIVIFTVICWTFAVLAASVLRDTVSLKWAVLSTVPAAGVVGLLIHFFKAEILHYWQFSIRKSFAGISEAELQQLGDENVTAMFEKMPLLITEALSSWVLFIVLCGVFIARYWQAQLFNEGGFQKEFHTLRLGKEAVLAFAIAIGLANLFGGTFWAAIASAMLFLFFIQGLSVLHCLTKQRGLSKGWLTGMYAMLWLPPTMIALSLLGIVDNFFQIRKI